MSRQGMSIRARICLIIPGVTCLIIGILAIRHPVLFDGPSYAALRLLVSVSIWGWFPVGTGLLCLTASVQGSLHLARAGFFFSCSITGWLAGSIIAAWFIGERIGPVLLPVLFGYTALQLVLMWQPLRTPLEEILRTDGLPP